MTCLNEYDLEFKPVHTKEGHGLFRLAAKAMDSPAEDPSSWDKEIEMHNIDQVPPASTTTS